MSTKDTSPTHAKTGDAPTTSLPAGVDESDNGASLLIESPVEVKSGVAGQHEPALAKRHDFPDGGGSGGAEAFRRANVKPSH